MRFTVTGITRSIAEFAGRHAILVEVASDAGIRGIGEAAVTDDRHAALGALRDLEPALLGQDAFALERFRVDAARRLGSGAAVLARAIAAVEMALWDIKGKALHVPVYQCLGGRVRDRVRVCVSLPPGQRAEESADVAARLAALGVTALKCPVRPRHTGVAQRGDLEDVAERVARIREAAGPDVDLIIDLQSTSTPALARQISRVLERFRPCLMSEPIEPAGLTGLTRLTTRTRVPTCVDGSSRPTSLGLLETRAAGVLRLDVGACGGLIAARHVASAAEIGYTAVIAADTGGWIGAAATRQFAAATPNVLFLELPDHPRLWEGALLPSFALEAGHLPLGEEPGLGAEPMVEAIRAAGGSVTAC